MAKSVKLTNDTYLDTSSITWKRINLDDIIRPLYGTIVSHPVKGYNSITDFLNEFKTFTGYKTHIGYITIGGQNAMFFGYLQTYLNGYGRVIVYGTYNTYSYQLNNGTWNGADMSGNEVDMVVEKGDNYRKWSSGRAEAWGTYYEYATPLKGTAMGNIYRAVDPIPIDYPSGVFNSTPIIQVDIRYCGGCTCFITTYGYDSSATQNRSKYLASAHDLNRNLEYQVEWYAVGRWK